MWLSDEFEFHWEPKLWFIDSTLLEIYKLGHNECGVMWWWRYGQIEFLSTDTPRQLFLKGVLYALKPRFKVLPDAPTISHWRLRHFNCNAYMFNLFARTRSTGDIARMPKDSLCRREPLADINLGGYHWPPCCVLSSISPSSW